MTETKNQSNKPTAAQEKPTDCTELRELIYETLLDVLVPAYRLPCVENLFAPGQPCYENYNDVLDAYERLRERLGVENDDEDVEIIITSLLSMGKTVALKMFDYGTLFEKMQEQHLR